MFFTEYSIKKNGFMTNNWHKGILIGKTTFEKLDEIK